MSSPSADNPIQNWSPSKVWMLILGWMLVRLVTRDGHPRVAASSHKTGLQGAATSPDEQPGSVGGANERGRGRQADKPTEVPVQGWKDIFWRVYEGIQEDRVMLVAAGVTFYSLLAIFPAITALVSIYGLFADPTTIESHLQNLSGVLPSGALQIIGEQVHRIASKGSGTLGISFVVSLGIALWSANAGMKSIFDALNIVYGETEKRSFLALNATTLAFTLGATLFLLFALAAVVVLPLIVDYLGLGPWAETLVALAPWPVLLGGVVLGLALIYRYGPSRDNPQWTWITPGSITAAVLWVIASVLFSWYVSNFGSYDATYGSLGAAIGFMTWIWISIIVVLLGAEINAETEHQTTKDTTEGAKQPLGTRGATMADTVGEAKG